MNKEDLKSFILVANFFVVTVLVFVGWKIYKTYTQTCKVEGFQDTGTCNIAVHVGKKTKADTTLPGTVGDPMTANVSVDACSEQCCTREGCKAFIYDGTDCKFYNALISDLENDSSSGILIGYKPDGCIVDENIKTIYTNGQLTQICETATSSV